MEIVPCPKLQGVQGRRAIIHINALLNQENSLAMEIVLWQLRYDPIRLV